MKIAIIGSRGIPARYGGFETFVEKISEILVKAGHAVSVYGEKDNAVNLKTLNGVEIKESDYKKSLNPLLFYFDSLRKSRFGYDIVLVCGVGGAPFYFLFKNKHSVIISNVDGLEHLRTKYSYLKKLFVRLAQRMARKYSDLIIADSKEVGNFWAHYLRCPTEKLKVITYGAEAVNPFEQKYLDQYYLIKDTYYIVVARLVPENHIQEIIQGYLKSESEKKLVIIGGLENTKYVNDLRQFENDNILFCNAIYHKETLDSLRQGAFGYIHGHSVGGTNPSLLEAMAASCLCICHDNIFNREVNSEEQLYFRNAEDLSRRIHEVEKLNDKQRSSLQHASYQRVIQNYSWEKIGEQYLQLFDEIYEGKHRI